MNAATLDQRMINYVKEQLTSTAPSDSKLKIGDTVNWVNPYGVKWTHKVIGFNTAGWYQKEHKKFVHLNTDCYWFPHCENELVKVSTEDEHWLDRIIEEQEQDKDQVKIRQLCFTYFGDKLETEL